MHQDKLIFLQLMRYLPLSTFRRCVADHRGEYKVKDLSCLDQFFEMAFAQLTYRESLHGIDVNLRAQACRLYHMGRRCQPISRNTLGNANAMRPWQSYADYAQHLIGMARPLNAQEPFGLELDPAVYAFDANTIDLSHSVFAWALLRKAKATIKLHPLLALRGNIPTFIHITDGKTHEVNILDDLILEPAAFYVMDRGYLDFSRHFVIHEAGAFFVTRTKSNTRFKRRYSHPVGRINNSVLCDKTGVLTTHYSRKDDTGKRVIFLTRNCALKPELIASTKSACFLIMHSLYVIL